MKKIVTREERERKEKRNKILIGLILVGIMVLSTIGYAFFQTSKKAEELEYKNIKFVLKEDGLWHAVIEGYELATIYNPKETENISMPFNLRLFDYKDKILYFSDDSEIEGVKEISRNIRVVSRTQFACISDCEKDFPIKDCNDNIIIIKEAEENLIKRENKCVYINAKKEDILKASDAFIFKLFDLN